MNSTQGYSYNPFRAPNSQTTKKRKLNGWSATIIFLSYIGTQIIFGFFLGVFATILFLIFKEGAKSKEALENFIQTLQIPTSIIALVAAIVVMLILSLHFGRELIGDRSPIGIAWNLGNRRNILIGLLMGLIAACIYILIAILIFPPDPDAPLSPLMQNVVSTGLFRWLWIFLILIIAPPAEEFLFRGVLFSGYSYSLGIISASIVSTFLFVIVHSFESVYYLPAYIGITALGITALLLRLKFRALGPSIAAHFSYNLAIAIIAITSIKQL